MQQHSDLTVASLTNLIQTRLQAEYVEVIDQSGGCGLAFHAIIVSHVFDNQPLLQRHRLVNECLKEEISKMHAFSQKTYTPDQYQSMKNNPTL